MTQHSRQTAPTRFVDAAGVRFAYRRFGKSGSAQKWECRSTKLKNGLTRLKLLALLRDYHRSNEPPL